MLIYLDYYQAKNSLLQHIIKVAIIWYACSNGIHDVLVSDSWCLIKYRLVD